MGDTVDLQPLKLLEDTPTEGFWVDELGLQGFSRVVAEAAVGTSGPFTIGVFANWGSGKTSVLKQAKTLIEKHAPPSDLVTVWFNAWQYEKEEHPIVPLLSNIVRVIEAHQREHRQESDLIENRWSKLCAALRALAYGFSGKISLSVPGFVDVAGVFSPTQMKEKLGDSPCSEDPLAAHSLYQDIFEKFAEVLDNDSGESSFKVVIFVDDLDRCLPDKALLLLESIKLVLAQKGFVFVIAVDRKVIESYLEKRYREEFNVREYRADGMSYMDKIVQLPLYLPHHHARFHNYIHSLLRRDAFKRDPGVGKVLDSLTEVLAVGSNYNPRSLVRFINNLLVDRQIRLRMNEPAGEDFMRICAVSRSLQQHLDERDYRHLVSDNDLCEAIASAPGEPITSRCQTQEENQNLQLRHRQRVLEALEYRGFLVELLDDSESGEHWLEDHKLRWSVDGFLKSQRQEEKAKPQFEIVENAIREALGKADDEPVTESDRANVRELDLALSSVDNTGLQRLASMDSLDYLDLSGAKVTDAGLRYLSNLRGMKYLNLSDTSITDAGLTDLTAMRELLHLNLSNTSVGDPGVETLRQVASLSELLLKGTRIGNDSLSVLSTFPHLRKLDVGGTSLNDGSVDYLKEMTDLSYLALRETQISKDAKEKLMKSLPKCRVTG